MLRNSLILVISCIKVCNCACLISKAPISRKITSLGNNDDNKIPPPTPEDERLEEWYAQQGILGTDRVKVRTSSRSVAGRGLFYSSLKPAQQGDMLALIPCECVLTKQNAERQWPDFKENDDDIHDWSVSLTMYAERAVKNNDWRPWTQAWIGPSAPRPPESFRTDELQELALQAQSSPDEIKKALQVRYDVFQKDAHRFENHDIYAIVLSRVANLGPNWNGESGIIPLHDMVNHPPLNVEHNIELFSIKDIASLTSDDYVTSRAQSTFSIKQPDDQDLVLVARKIIYPGEELFLAYAKRDLTEEERVWKMLQYGFSLSS